MLYVNIKDIPWDNFPQTFTNTVADVASETYSFTKKDVSIACNSNEDVTRLVATMNILTASRDYGIVAEDGPIKTIGKVQRPESNVGPAIMESPPATRVAVQERPVGTPATTQGFFFVNTTVEPHSHIITRVAVPERPAPTPPRNSIVPVGDVFNRLIDRSAVSNRIPDQDLESRLYGMVGDKESKDNSEIDRLRLRYASIHDDLVATMRRINALSSLPKDNGIVKNVISQLRTISSGMPDNKITECYVTNKYIILKTCEIHAKDSSNDKKYNLGRIMITISLAGLMSDDKRECSINYQPLDHYLNYEGNIHLLPHVGTTGTCFGNMTDMIIEAFAKRDIITLVDLAIRFIENPNVDDVLGRTVRMWPEVA